MNEMDKLRMEHIVQEMEVLKKKQNIRMILVGILMVMLVFAEAYLFMHEGITAVISSIIAPMVIGVILLYFDVDLNQIDKYNNCSNELYEIGKHYYSVEQVNQKEKSGLLKIFAETVGK